MKGHRPICHTALTTATRAIPKKSRIRSYQVVNQRLLISVNSAIDTNAGTTELNSTDFSAYTNT